MNLCTAITDGFKNQSQIRNARSNAVTGTIGALFPIALFHTANYSTRGCNCSMGLMVIMHAQEKHARGKPFGGNRCRKVEAVVLHVSHSDPPNILESQVNLYSNMLYAPMSYNMSSQVLHSMIHFGRRIQSTTPIVYPFMPLCAPPHLSLGEKHTMAQLNQILKHFLEIGYNGATENWNYNCLAMQHTL
ncbi:hypothetical protein ACJX0J_033357 [Zea mays]